MSKTLIIYCADSHYKFYNLYVDYAYDPEENGNLAVYKIDRIAGDDTLVALFRTWDYFIIEGEHGEPL